MNYIKKNKDVIDTIKRGDLYLYDFGQNEGSIQCGFRPVIVLQSDRFEQSPTVIVAAITTAVKKQYLPSHILIGKEYGLDQDSMIMVEQIRTINRGELKKKIGFVGDEELWKSINNAIKKTFGLWLYTHERIGNIRCLCASCVNDYKTNPGFIVKRLDPFSKKTDKCEKCDKLGYDYLVYDKKVAI